MPPHGNGGQSGELVEARVLLEERRAGHNEVCPTVRTATRSQNAFFEGWLMREKNQAVEAVYNPGLP
jgi:hypothetical protein